MEEGSFDSQQAYQRLGSLPDVHEKPCRICRRRKVRCSKIKPCNNCERAGEECTFDEPALITKPSLSPALLANRVSQLESVIESLLKDRESGSSKSTSTSENREAPVFTAGQVAQRLTASLGQSCPFDMDAVYRGRLVTDDGSSRHLLNSFWASMYDEIGDLKYLLRPEQPQSESSSWLLRAPELESPFLCSILSPASADYLLEAFISHIDQFVRVLHKPTLLRRMSHYRRGILADGIDFECQLSGVFSLAVLSLTDDDCVSNLGDSRDALLMRFRRDVEVGLGHLNITTTHRISSLQSLLLHISYLIWNGEVLHASSLLALAVRNAQRLGIHRDGENFNLSPWDVELRRRLWHYILLVDTFCMENHGLESAIGNGFSDTRLPQNSSDAVWDTSEASTVRPKPQNGYTDMTFALVQYEAAALMRVVLMNSVPIAGEEKAYSRFHAQLRQDTWEQVERRYLQGLDISQIRQSLTKDIARLTFRRIHLTQLRPLGRSSIADSVMMKELEFKLIELALSFCDEVQAIRQKYAPERLDWAIIRVFSWHALATELSTVLRKDAFNASPAAQRSWEKVARVFRDRPCIDFLKGNDSLWVPLHRLHSELQVLHLANEQLQQQQLWQPDMTLMDTMWDDSGLWETF